MLVLGALVLVNLYVFVWDKKTGVRAIKQQAEAVTTTPAMSIPSSPLAASSHVASTTVVEGKVAKSETLGKVLKKSGLTTAESDEIIRAVSGVLDFRAIRAGQSFRIERAPDGRVKRFELDLSKAHRVTAERQASGELRADAT
jgi:hypothetical protein